MDRNQLFAATLGLSAVNGMFSPYLDLVVAMSPLWLPSWLAGSASLIFYASSLLTATTTLLVAGIPAAIAERLRPALAAGTGSLKIWAAGALVLTMPGLLRIAALVAA